MKLIECLCNISDPLVMQQVLTAVLTPKELQEIENRLHIFDLLAQQVPQRDIAAQLGVGIATVTRGAHAFREGRIEALAPHLKLNLTQPTQQDKR
jgi:Trp operon repressor